MFTMLRYFISKTDGSLSLSERVKPWSQTADAAMNLGRVEIVTVPATNSKFRIALLRFSVGSCRSVAAVSDHSATPR